MVRCRVCLAEIEYTGWAKHVEKHKKHFCREHGIDQRNHFKVPWELIVRTYNPAQAKKQKKKETVTISTPQTKLTHYEGGTTTC